jgi:hypothetical protein
MIISNTLGGLGNQMFQYAVGRALSLKSGQPLLLDVSHFGDNMQHRGFELSYVFSGNFQIATQFDIDQLLGWQSPIFARKLLARSVFAKFRSNQLIVEPHFHYWSEIEHVPEKCYLSGYWQSEKYFGEYESEIRRDFLFREPLGEKNTVLARQMSQCVSVSLHVRRGDYLTNPKANAIHGLCSLDYYRSAIQYILERTPTAKFFVFSDDIPWVRLNLPIEASHDYVEHNRGEESYNDMRLMSMCQHHIIANSSFSWWGAWLSPRFDGIVIAPAKWFKTGINTKDLIPSGWLCL